MDNEGFYVDNEGNMVQLCIFLSPNCPKMTPNDLHSKRMDLPLRKGQKIHRGHWVKKGISRKIRERRFIRSVSLFFYSPRLSLVKGFAGKKIASYFYKEQNVSDLRF